MATLVCFHAHPDDEAIATAGVMALAADAGHRVVLVLATRGEQGEPVPGTLEAGEPLWARREAETRHSAEILGVERVEFLGYVDSGMMGEPSNDDPACFWQADVEDAARRLAALLDEVGADALTVYDDHGGYGHPDHIQVHRVGRRAAELAGLALDRVLASTMNRDAIARMRAEPGPAEPPSGIDLSQLGTPEDEITHAVDVRPVLARKRLAIEAHRSQITAESFFLALAPEAFADAFGTEWFTSYGTPRAKGAPFRADILDGLDPRAGGRP